MARNPQTLVALAIVAGLTAPARVAAGQDWPQWRGPNRDGAVTSFSEPASWPEGLTEQWTVDVGLGYATPLLVGDRIYTYTRQDEDEVVMALSARSGEIIWRTSYPASYNMPPATSRPGAASPGARLGYRRARDDDRTPRRGSATPDADSAKR